MADEERKEKIISALKNLIASDGWKIMVKVLQANIRDAQMQLEGNEITDLAQLKRIQDKLFDRRELLAMPDELIEQYGSDESKQFPVELDPYA